ncbi:PREDICTED: N-acetylmuramoyl-L-alanine amidase [Chrysochloris asiatica]|uniref:N-acetylmuramoyl-L-alanine amidase n=1 Tax=Chrysochloris asiatica TaxID=185453 RepID=A0A9B0U4J3_CHRAS|nr:PREDICTED: N-acetylmuramoyl-L-alanine amidase [Chrysochloris asiatica]
MGATTQLTPAAAAAARENAYILGLSRDRRSPASASSPAPTPKNITFPAPTDKYLLETNSRASGSRGGTGRGPSQTVLASRDTRPRQGTEFGAASDSSARVTTTAGALTPRVSNNPPGSWNPIMVAQGILWILLGLLLCPEPGTASYPLLMDFVIQALGEFEQKAPATEARPKASAWLLSAQDTSPSDLFHSFLLEGQGLKDIKLDPLLLSPELQDLMEKVAQHGVRDGQEYGVVLAPDGSTVAVQPLLAGLQAGLLGRRVVNLPLNNTAPPGNTGNTFPNIRVTVSEVRATSPEFKVISPDVEATSPDTKATLPTSVDSLLAVTLARDLGLTFLQDLQTQNHPVLGTEGCWDKLNAPQTFTLLDRKASPLTTAFLNGALDGALLGDYLSQTPEPKPPLSLLLSQYYGAGVAGEPELRSNFRRQNGAVLTSAPTLTQEIWGTLLLLQRLESAHPQLHGMSGDQLAQVASHATKEFTEVFLECPAIHPRCRWNPEPYVGQPTPLKLPLGFLYVHHTYIPKLPCTDFVHCSDNMRSMQRFHQKTRGWDDIGYSFVVGSDGYVYEGRGWHRVGAHTRGYNSRGFGVAFVGNYTAELPTEAALRTVREELPRCAMRAGYLRPDYKVLGHRQLVSTSCPGDALFNLLRTWPRFTDVKSRTVRRTSWRSRKEPPLILPAEDSQ